MSSRRYIIAIIFILIGTGFYIFNYERHTHILSSSGGNSTLVHYEAPAWDPFPHTLKIVISADAPVMLTVKYSGVTNKEDTFSFQNEAQEWIIHPGEIIDITLEYLEGNSGAVKTVLWCDSWILIAIFFLLIGILVIFSKP